MLNASGTAEWGLYIAIVLFLVGLVGLVCRRNLIFMMICLEIMLNAANLAFMSAAALTQTFDGQVMAFFVMGVAACEAAVGLALVVAIYKARSTIAVDDLTVLKG